jgi:hypothetical protein
VVNFEKVRVTLVAPKGAMIACINSSLPYSSLLMLPEEHEYRMGGLAELMLEGELQRSKKVPAVQNTHLSAVWAPTPVKYDPAAQFRHMEEPVPME